VQSLAPAGHHRARLGAGCIANGYQAIEFLAGLDDIRHATDWMRADVDTDLTQHGDGERIERAGIQSRALCFEQIAAHVIQQRLGHLAASAVVNANEEHSLFHGPYL
jgi:hypothetical protein